jgi:predicted site-specific integrase-resolvase
MEQLPSGTVIVTEAAAPPVSGVGLYARVSSSDQKNDLEAQLGRLLAYANSQGWTVVKSVTEVGSGLNGRRPKLMKLLVDPDIGVIVVEHRDRLMRFGAEYVEAALAAQGRKLVVIDPAEVKDDLVQDMIEVLTSFCVRLYGRRSARNKAKKALEAMEAADE